jgi:2-polyprenyl-6-methoxyphenol hydroxylase-like FAD-dependent oxidoreductase
LILIVGAGPTGLNLALWLTKLGVKVRIIDRTALPGTTSRALAVQVRTLELYHQIGIDTAVIDEGVKVPAANLWLKGGKAARIRLEQAGEDRTPYPFVLMYPQDAHERLLILALEQLGIHVERETELLRFEDDGQEVHATVKRKDGSTEMIACDYLGACDGAASTVRQQLGLEFPGGTYEGLFYVADCDARGPTTNGEIHGDIEAADFVIVFPIKQSGRIRLIGTLHDLEQRPDLTFDDVKGKALAHLDLEIDKVNWFSTYRVHHRVVSQFRKGRAFLCGDAAHIHSPVGGQGMNTGIGDAINLAWKLAAVVKETAPARLLDSFEIERSAFARRLVKTTDRAFTLVTSRDRVARFIRRRLVPLFAPILFRLRPVRRFLFGAVSQLNIHYRNSFLSQGKAGRVHAGDRLPWLGNNFEALSSLRWQVHVYGVVRRGLEEVCREYDLPLHQFDWKRPMRQNALYLIRPDGYIGFCDSRARPKKLRAYLAASLSK